MQLGAVAAIFCDECGYVVAGASFRVALTGISGVLGEARRRSADVNVPMPAVVALGAGNDSNIRRLAAQLLRLERWLVVEMIEMPQLIARKDATLFDVVHVADEQAAVLAAAQRALATARLSADASIVVFARTTVRVEVRCASDSNVEFFTHLHDESPLAGD